MSNEGFYSIAAKRVQTLINSRPSSPSITEIEAVISKAHQETTLKELEALLDVEVKKSRYPFIWKMILDRQ